MPSKISDPEIATLWSITSKMIDWLNFMWQVYIAFTGVVVGWLFSSGRSLTLSQKYVVTAIFTLAYLMSVGTIIKTYTLLYRTLVELKKATETLETFTPGFKNIFQRVPGKGYWTVGLLVHLAWYAICILQRWSFGCDLMLAACRHVRQERA